MCDGATCGIQSGRFDAGLFVFVSAVAHVFNCKIKRCVFLLSLLLIGNKCNYPQKGYKHISLALFVFFSYPLIVARPGQSLPIALHLELVVRDTGRWAFTSLPAPPAMAQMSRLRGPSVASVPQRNHTGTDE